MKLTRLEAIQDIRLGRGIQVSFVGLTEDRRGAAHTFNVIVRRHPRGGAVAVIDSSMSYRNYTVPLTWVQVLNFIRRNYDRGIASPMSQAA